MKKRMLILCLVLILLLCGCKKVPESYTVQVKGREMTVNVKSFTITHGTDTYTYIRTGAGVENQMNYYTTIHYPNGGKWEIKEEFVGSLCVSSKVETSDDFDSREYLDGEILLEAIKQALEQKSAIESANPQLDWERLAFGIFALSLGGLGLLCPRKMWNIRVMFKRWRYKDLDPTEEGLAAYQIGSGILVVLGVIFILIAF